MILLMHGIQTQGHHSGFSQIPLIWSKPANVVRDVSQR